MNEKTIIKPGMPLVIKNNIPVAAEQSSTEITIAQTEIPEAQIPDTTEQPPEPAPTDIFLAHRNSEEANNSSNEDNKPVESPKEKKPKHTKWLIAGMLLLFIIILIALIK